jgi:hypothetical protein
MSKTQPTAIALGNVRVISSTDVPNHRAALIVRIDRGTVFGNPVTIKKAGGRDNALRLYRKHLWTAISAEKPTPEQVALRDALRSLVKASASGAEIRLVCHCKPKACHGDVLRSFLSWAVNKMADNQKARTA